MPFQVLLMISFQSQFLSPEHSDIHGMTLVCFGTEIIEFADILS